MGIEKETLEKAVKYLQIVDSMEATEWYLNEFRGHEDWEIGLTTTIKGLIYMLREKVIPTVNSITFEKLIGDE